MLMKKSIFATMALLLLLSTAWSQEKVPGKRKRAKRQTASEPVSKNGVAATFTNVRYGPDKRNLLDIWLAKSDKPTPLVIYIHGGGFLHNDKSKAYGLKEIDQFLAAGVSFATISYRYRTNPEGILGSLKDAKLALQFLRSKSGEYNLDKTRVGAYGSSAGAGTSLWLAFHDDMADPQNPDPVLRESTRLKAAGAFATQSTYDISQWPKILNHPNATKWPREKHKKELDMLIWMSIDDPPFYAWNGQANAPVDLDNPQMNLIYHHPLHIKALKTRVEEIGVKGALLYAPALKIAPEANESSEFVPFMLRHLQELNGASK